MHDAAALLIALIFLVVSFFVALIAPKGKRKLLWLFVWFMVFFADGFITSAIFHYYGNLYGKINVYEKPTSRGYYAGEREIVEWNRSGFPLIDSTNWLNSPVNTTDANFISLINGYVNFIDYKEKSENPVTNGKYFRIYLDDYTADIKPSKILSYIKYNIKDLKQIYKDKCVARKEINEDEIASAELIIKYPYAIIEEKPNIKTMFDKIIGMGFNYGGLIKDRNTGKILADNTYIYESYHSWLIQGLTNALGPESGGPFWMCNKNETTSIEKCNQKMIEEFFKK